MKASLFWAVFTVVVSCIFFDKILRWIATKLHAGYLAAGASAPPSRRQVWLCSIDSKHSTPGRQPQCPTQQPPIQMQQCKRRWSQECCNHPAWPCKYQNIIYSSKKCRHKFLPGFRILPKGWAANLGLRSGAEKTQLFYISSLQKKTQSLRPPDTQVFTSLHRCLAKGLASRSSVHWLSEQRMSQMASTNGPQEPMDPRKGIAKATMPSTIPIAPITWTCDNKIQVSNFVVVPSGKVI